MAAPAMQAIANITLSAASATVTFSNIPQTYRDLRLVVQGSLSANSNYFKLNFNGDTGGTYSYTTMRGDGSSASSASVTGDVSIYQTPSSIGANVNTMITCDVLDYSATDKHKSTLTRSHSDGVYVWAIVGRWANTSAITSVTIAPYSGNLNAGSTFTLYGVLA